MLCLDWKKFPLRILANWTFLSIAWRSPETISFVVLFVIDYMHKTGRVQLDYDGSETIYKRNDACAWTHLDLYYANRYMSSVYPHKCLTIMQDKMDHVKTASPAFFYKSKQLDVLKKLPVLVTWMIAHKHGNVCCDHYGFNIFLHDSNYIMESLAKLLWDLELPPTYSSRELFYWVGIYSSVRSSIERSWDVQDITLTTAHSLDCRDSPSSSSQYSNGQRHRW